MKLIDLIFATTDDKLFKDLENKPLNFYLGVDPTSDSLHIGHLAMLIMGKRLMTKGHKFHIVLGGLTAMIGDPSGKKSERKLLEINDLKKNVDKLEK